MSADINLGKFRIKDMVQYCTVAIIAKRGTGKSYLTREILYHKRKIPVSIVISLTEKLNKFYTEFIPDGFIYDRFSIELLNGIFKRQREMLHENEIRESKGKHHKADELMLVMDDCLSSKGTWVKDQNIAELFYNGRHYHLSFILTMQFSLGLPPEFRSNLDYVFLLGEDVSSNLKRLYDHYAGMFQTLDIFKQIFSQVTEDFGCLVVNNRIHSKDPTEKVFWYRAKETPSFRLGCSKYIKYNKKHYDPLWDKRDIIDNNNIDSLLTGRQRKLRVNVKKVK